MNNWHHGRAWHGHAIEDACPCPQEPCGLVSTPSPDCVQHGMAKTIRQGHPPDQCPGPASESDEDRERQEKADARAAQWRERMSLWPTPAAPRRNEEANRE